MRSESEVAMQKKNEIVLSNIDSSSKKNEYTLVELDAKEIKKIKQ